MINAFDVNLLAESVTAFVSGAQPLVLFRRHIVVTVQINVAAHAEVFDAGYFFDVIEMIQVMLDGRRLIVLDEHPHPRNAHHSARRGHLPDRLIGLAAWMTGGERAAV